MPIKNEWIQCNEYQKSLNQKPLFEIPLFRFHFVSSFSNKDCCYNEYPVKQAPLLYFNLPLKPVLF